MREYTTIILAGALTLLITFAINLHGRLTDAEYMADQATQQLNVCLEAPEVFLEPRPEAFVSPEYYEQAMARWRVYGNWAS